ncbi:MAG TPA: hypothetical protein PKY96_11885, partial [Flavobacteriales bacterium]|nr:hypothetical protein [Flavobacteriales bacterium]
MLGTGPEEDAATHRHEQGVLDVLSAKLVFACIAYDRGNLQHITHLAEFPRNAGGARCGLFAAASPRFAFEHQVIEAVGARFHIQVGTFAGDGVVLDEEPIGIQVEVVAIEPHAPFAVALRSLESIEVEYAIRGCFERNGLRGFTIALVFARQSQAPDD